MKEKNKRKKNKDFETNRNFDTILPVLLEKTR